MAEGCSRAGHQSSSFTSSRPWPVADLKRRFRAETLEAAFMAATGRSFEDEQDERDRKELA
jgi:hypothetical protein